MARGRTPSRQRTEATPDPRLGSAQRVVVMTTVVLVSVVFFTPLNDIYALPKLLMLALGAIVLLGTMGASLASSGRIPIPQGPALALAVAFALLMALAAVLGDHWGVSVVGEYGRNAGLLAYGSAAVLFFATLSSFDSRSTEALARVLVVSSALVMAYGLLQVAGLEPFHVPDSGVVSTLGQVNYIGGFTGIAMALLLWSAFSRSHGPRWRVLGALGAGATVLVGMKAQSFQAYPSLVAGSLLVVLVWATDRFAWKRVLVMVGAGAVVVVLVAVVLHGTIEQQVRDGLDERVQMWQAAGQMIEERPVLGFGPSGYAANFTTYRPRSHAMRFGSDQIVDVPHSVPLSMFVTGGFVLGLVYLAFVGWVGLGLVRGLRRARGERRLLLAGIGGGWFAYQVQSTVSIDTPTLVAYHFALAAAVVVLARQPDHRVVRVPPLEGRWHGRRYVVSSLGQVVRAGIAVLAVIGLVLVVRVAIADRAYATARQQRATGLPETSLASFSDATSTAPWNGLYWGDYAAALAASGDQDGALAVGQKAADLSPSRVFYALTTAQLAEVVGQVDLAREFFDKAARRSPNVVLVDRAVAQFYLRQKEYPLAVHWAEVAAELAPADPDVISELARVYAASGDKARARRAWERVLELRAGDPAALEALGRSPADS
jgi:O-antigen ligase